MRLCARTCLLAALALTPALASAQTQTTMFSNLVNPAIGINALFSAQAAPTLNQPYGPQFDEAELSAIAVVDPYWTLSANIVFLEGAVDPEEIWARSTNIPSLQLKLGKLRGTFGKHPLLHPHAFPFVEAPIAVTNAIGEEGFKDAGLEAAWLTPLPWFAELTGGVYHALDVSDDNPLDFGSSRHDNLPFLGHFKNQFDVTGETTLEAGASYLQGRGTDDFVHSVVGADLTVRNVPAKSSNRSGWILQGEWLQKGANIGGDYVAEQRGGYGSFQYRLSQVWWAGVRGERALDSTTDFMTDAFDSAVRGAVSRGTVNIAWVPSEFSCVRLEYSHAKADVGAHPTDDRILLQLSYTIGFHPAHAY